MKHTTLKLIGSYLLVLLFLLICSSAKAQSPCGDKLCVVQFNAGWNADNEVTWIEDLTDCSKKSILIDNGDWQKKYGIVVVPTVIIFNEGEEVKRYQADISFTLPATQEEVQGKIDEIVLESSY
jgi:hypothetical protein